MLNICVPMAGLGSRFTAAGYADPKPFIDVCDNQMLGFKIVLCDSFSQVIKHQFLKSLCVQLVDRDHFTFVGRFLCFNDYSDRAFGFVTIMDYKVVSSFSINEMLFLIF